MIFYKLLKRLCEKYFVVMVDLLGMGRSSRPRFTHTKLKACEDFFVPCLEVFCENEGFDNFTIAGHSFGGYVACCYTLAYPIRVNQVILLSPIGVNEAPANWDYLKFLKEKDWKFRWVMKFVSYFWMKNITPATILRNSGPLSENLLKIYSYEKLRSLGKDKILMQSYLEQINLLPASGELSLIYILNPGGMGISPLCSRLGPIKVPLLFFYGDRDWVKSIGAEQTSKFNKKVILKIIEDAGHDLYWDNPEDFLNKLFEALSEAESFKHVP
jgi:pimeloyl-ACP methyl ester carboxylesterase